MFKHVLKASGLLALMVVIGCGSGGGGSGKTAVVKGKVTVNGAPLSGGTITFSSASNESVEGGGTINADGTYEAGGVPMGECKIAIDNSSLKDLTTVKTDPLPGMPAPPKYIKIDAKYYKAATSGLTVNVDSSSKTHDIDLK